jgi:hypothetical protein
MNRVSAVLITRNEAPRIRACVEGLRCHGSAAASGKGRAGGPARAAESPGGP